MQKPRFTSTTALHESDRKSLFGPDTFEPRQPGPATAGIIVGYPVMIVAVIGLLLAGRPFLETLLIAVGLQALAFTGVIVVGLIRSRSADRSATDTQNTAHPDGDLTDFLRTYRGSEQGEKSRQFSLISDDVTQRRTFVTGLTALGQEMHHAADSDAMPEKGSSGSGRYPLKTLPD